MWRYDSPAQARTSQAATATITEVPNISMVPAAIVVHQQSRRAEAFVKRGDFKRALSSHQAATATLRHLIRSITDGQLAELRRSAARADEFALLESLYAQLEQHTQRQSALLEDMQLLTSRPAAKSGGTMTHQQAATHLGAAGSPVGGGGVRSSAATPVRSPMRDGPGNTEVEERDILIGNLRRQLDVLARKNEALIKENESLKAASHLPPGSCIEQPRPVAAGTAAGRAAHGAAAAAPGLDYREREVIAALEDSGDYLDVSIQTGRALRDLPPLKPPAFDPQGFESD